VVCLTHRHKFRSETKCFSETRALWCLWKACRQGEETYLWMTRRILILLPDPFGSAVSGFWPLRFLWLSLACNGFICPVTMSVMSHPVQKWFCSIFVIVSLPWTAFHQLFHWVRASQLILAVFNVFRSIAAFTLAAHMKFTNETLKICNCCKYAVH